MVPSLVTSARICAAVAALLYLNSLDCGLVFDDIAAIKKNNDLRPTSSWLNLLYDDYWGQPMNYVHSHKSYRPLTVATFRLNYMLHELQPLGYHLVNVLLHSAVCYLYVLLCGVVFSEVWPALIAGLLFAVHPIHTEAVSGVVGRAELLAGLFFISAFFCYRNSIRKGGVWWQMCAMATVVCSMLSKEQGITALGFCVVYDFVSGSQGSPLSAVTKYLSGKLPRQQELGSRENLQFYRRTFYTAVFGVVTVALRIAWGQGRPSPQVFHRYVNPPLSMDTPYRQLNWLYLCFVNSWLLLNPFNLCADWRFGAVPVITSLMDPHNLLTVLTFVCLAGVGLWSVSGSGEGHRAGVLGLSLLVLPYLPASNLFFPVGFVVAERVLYLPSMGFCLLVGYGAWHLLQRTLTSKLLHLFMRLALAFLLLSHSLKTVTRNRDWHSGFTIFTTGIQRNPSSGVMLSNLGVEYAINKEYITADRLYRASMEIAPGYSRAFFNYGKLMKIQKAYEDAEWVFQRAIALGINDTTDNKLGEIYYHLIEIVALNPQRQEEALELYEHAMRYAYAYNRLYVTKSSLLLQMNRTYEALEATEVAARMNPSSSVVHYNLGLILMKLNQLTKAAVSFRTALTLKPNSVQVMYNLASVLQMTANGDGGLLQESMQLWMKLLSTDPHHTDALSNLASLYYELKDFSKTRKTLHQVLQVSPNHTDTHYRLGILDYMQGNYRKAMETFSKVSSLQPGYKRTESYLELTQRELVHQRTSL